MKDTTKNIFQIMINDEASLATINYIIRRKKAKVFLIATQIFLHKVLQVLIQLILIHKLPQQWRNYSQFAIKRVSEAFGYRKCYFGMLNFQWKFPYHSSYKNSSNRTYGITSAFPITTCSIGSIPSTSYWLACWNSFIQITWNVHSSLKHKNYTFFQKISRAHSRQCASEWKWESIFEASTKFFVEIANK